MANASVEHAILEQVTRLAHDAQLEVLQFAESLARSAVRGEPGKDLLKLVGCIPPEDLKEIMEAIEERM